MYDELRLLVLSLFHDIRYGSLPLLTMQYNPNGNTCAENTEISQTHETTRDGPESLIQTVTRKHEPAAPRSLKNEMRFGHLRRFRERKSEEEDAKVVEFHDLESFRCGQLIYRAIPREPLESFLVPSRSRAYINEGQC